MSYRPICDMWFLARAKLKGGKRYYGATGFMQHRYGSLKDAKGQGQSKEDWYERRAMAYHAYHDLLSRVFAPGAAK